ncbi:MAG: type IV-A pilus assembly ATPase PilB [Gammaproteobacteria bacterium]|nr:type IV-A pilus assembly ATPase PilB [Gammaproteobacteria bacterium]MCY4181829.1 type IV-A pilus assembly ATPase PilB [Gammaproteobacteria bacterium]MCY4295962.1 type IV-A pilus assembly ATPase PilB [Gammaproteobacteria bacterium]
MLTAPGANPKERARQAAAATAAALGAPLLDLDAVDPHRIERDVVDRGLIRQYQTLPLLRRGGKLLLALAEPAALAAVDEIKFRTGLAVQPVVVEADKLDRALRLRDRGEGLLDGIGLEELREPSAASAENASPAAGETGVDETPIVRLVNRLLLDALQAGASDIHFEPFEAMCRVRFRIDGVLHEITRPPVEIARRIASRLKIMAQMDISERRLPQDGRIRLPGADGSGTDFRVNTLPTLWGEKLVLRILDGGGAQMDIDALGLSETQRGHYLSALRASQGLILVTGPTGSGKTVTLYAGLRLLNTPERNIATAEDPVEINLEGINQVAVNNRIGLDFAACLRAFLRQDPDVLMVGEIRDLETAGIAVKAAQTGHLVLSTLHTNSAGETLTRLKNMGVPAFNLATSARLIIAQRLARKLCAHCRAPQDLPDDALAEAGFPQAGIDHPQLYSAQGCERCKNGYRGRVGIYEMLPVSADMAGIIMADGNALEIAAQAAAEGHNSLRSAALEKAAAGLTSLDEVNRVTWSAAS